MLRFPVLVLTTVLALAACSGSEGGRSFSYRGVSAGMSLEQFQLAAAASGGLECRPLIVVGLPADLLCYSPDTAVALVRFTGAVSTSDSTVPYVTVREILASPEAYGRLDREWGQPDTTVGTARRWNRGRWTVTADTAVDILTVWLADTVTDRLVAMASARELRGTVADTMPVFNDDVAVLDSLLADTSGGPAPLAARDLAQKPSVIRCSTMSPPETLAGVDGSVIVAYIVDTAGMVEPGSVRISQASHAGLIPAAIASVRTCQLTPGRLNGRPVRTALQQRVTFAPRAAPAE